MRLAAAGGEAHISGMPSIGLIAIAVGVVVFLLIALASVLGPRDRSGRLGDRSGPLVPYDSDGSDG